jgi:undecaprenyl-diphosphatase
MRLPPLTSLGIGFFQCLALVPGVSRSGATIAGALLLGVDRRAAAEFSFFLAIPTMVAATGLDLFKARHDLNMNDAGLIAVGFVVSFIAGWIVIRAMLDYVTRRGFSVFGWWRILIGGIGLVALHFA